MERFVCCFTGRLK